MKIKKEQDMEKLQSLFHKVAIKEPLDIDEQRLLGMLLEESEWKEIHEKLSDGEYVCGRLDDFNRYPKREAFRTFSQRVYGRSMRGQVIWRVAAVAAVLVVVITSLFIFMRSETVESLLVATHDIPAGTRKASLVLATGEVVSISNVSGQIMEDSTVQVNNRDGELVYSVTSKSKIGEGRYNELIVPRGGEYSIVLEDGTKVKLNADSRLRYPVKFSSRERRVEVKGEAFFEVAENKDIPFVVTCGKVQMKVLGTSFNVNNYCDEPFVTTTLITGKLEVMSPDRQVVLLPGVQSRVDVITGKIDTRVIDTENYVAWINNKFSFKEESLDLILISLARWYDVEFIYEGMDVRDYRLTGKIPRHCTLEEVVVLLEKIADVRFSIKNKKVVVKKR